MQQTPCIAGLEAGQRELVCQRQGEAGAYFADIQIDNLNICLMPTRTAKHMRTLRVYQQIIQRLIQRGAPNTQETRTRQTLVVPVVVHQPIKNFFGPRVVGDFPEFTASAKRDDKTLSPCMRLKHQRRLHHSAGCQRARRGQIEAANRVALAILQQQPTHLRVGCQLPQTVT